MSEEANPTSFEQLNLRSDLLRGIYAYGFHAPSAAQSRAIPAILNGRDVILQSRSGTGKTAAFAIPVLQLVELEPHCPQALLLSNTRELAEQTQRVLQALAAYTSLVVHCCVGGRSIEEDMRVLQLGAHVVSGTPGRVFDMIQRRALITRRIRLLVIDEADEMLAGEFKSQLYELYRYLPPSQVVLVSATLPRSVLALADRFMKSPLRLLVRKERLALEGVRQYFINVNEEQYKLDTLCDLYERFTITQSVVFLNSRERVDELGKSLAIRGFAVCAIHGGLSQRERERAAAEFRAGDFRVLLATDVWARGLDVQQVSFVLNYDLPASSAQYLHRIGRSGRFGRAGVAVSFAVAGEVERLRDIARVFDTRIDEMPESVEGMN